MIQKAKVTAVIGNPNSEGAISMIAIHNLEIPYRFPASVLRRPRRPARSRSRAARTGGTSRSSPSIRPTPRTTTTRSTPSRTPTKNGGHIVIVAIADVAAYVRPGTALDREAYLR